MKKFLAFILATVMLAAIAVPALADDFVTYGVCPAGKHTYNSTPITRYDYVDNATHNVVEVVTKICSKCGDTVTYPPKTVDEAVPHVGYYVSASCAGRIQTHFKRCNSCGGTYTTTMVCPGAVHSGDCHWLPI